MDISASVMNTWALANDTIFSKVCDGMRRDIRCQWPIRVFEKVCVCNDNWGGYDCSQCDFGYIINEAGDRCEKRNANQLLVRRNFVDLTKEEQLNYVKVLKRAKNEPVKKWSVVVDEPNDDSGRVTLQDVSVYDMLVVHHFLATREKDNKNCGNNPQYNMIDFAHEGPTFLTWHRYYLLIVESELHRIAESLGISNFALAYWDWNPMETNLLFTKELLGEPEHCDTPMEVRGSLFDGSDWPVVCERHYLAYLSDNDKGGEYASCEDVRKLCNVDTSRSNSQPPKLKRGIISDGDPILPNDDAIVMALAADSYYSNYGFNNRLEGFVDLCAGEDNQRCRIFQPNGGTHNNLHNAVHIYLSGHMRVIPTASNDPIFFLHHANVDRIFEAWLRKFNGNPPPYMPTSGEHPGHNRDDYLVPFFPLKTNEDMYKISSELGFRYDDTTWVIPTDSAVCNDKPNPCKRGTSPEGDTCPSPDTGGGGGTSTTSSGGGGTSSPDAGSSNFHIPLHLILIAGTSVLMVLKLFDM